MTMISGGDQKVRSAFRAKLRDEPSRPSVTATEKLSPDDVLEVRDLASAIARAEQMIRSSPSSRPRDIFDALLEGDASEPVNLDADGDQTDDCSGPALPAFEEPARSSSSVVAGAGAGAAGQAGVAAPGPGAPRRKATLAPAIVADPVRGPKALPKPLPVPKPAAKPMPMPMRVGATATQRLPVLYISREDDAFYQDGGRMRALADGTLETHRVEPTLLVRLRSRRKSLSWMVAAILVPLALLAGGGTLLRSRGSEASTRGPTHTTAAIVEASPKALEAKPVEAKPAEAKPAEAKPAEPAKAVGDVKSAAPKGEIPVFDVNSLPAAPPRRGATR